MKLLILGVVSILLLIQLAMSSSEKVEASPNKAELQSLISKLSEIDSKIIKNEAKLNAIEHLKLYNER
jgi:hypothetical protein